MALNTPSWEDERHLDIELVELARRPVGAGVLVPKHGQSEILVEPATMISCLNYAAPAAVHRTGRRKRLGTRKSRAPSGEVDVRIGVWNSMKP